MSCRAQDPVASMQSVSVSLGSALVDDAALREISGRGWVVTAWTSPS
jgi:hypothetical protein